MLAGFSLGERLLIKIDVEGFERAVLDGAAATLNRIPRPMWLIEICLTEHHPEGINPDCTAVFNIFWRAGYECRTADSERRLVTERDVARWVQCRTRDFGGINYLFSFAAEQNLSC